MEKYIKELREKIKKYSDYYYTNNESLISDVEFDKLLVELKELEEKYPEYKEKNSPTEIVGATSLKETKFQKVAHKKPMLSLSNSYNEGDISDFIERVKKLLPEEKNLAYALELKLDGLSLSIQYEEGKLVRAVTRGDGTVGEDVTENILEIESIPKILKEKVSIEIRGEVVLPLSKFEELNKKRMENGEEVFANPRNAAAGTLRQLDSSIIKERGLDAYFYFLVDAQNYGVKTHSESIEYLAKLGIKTTGVCEVLKNSSELISRIEYWGEKRESLDYETDGMVIEGLHVIEPTVFNDERGYFMETYNQNDFKEAGLNMVFVQDNQSSSRKGVLRGLHFQINYPQDKLVRVVSGEVFDVAVDLREGSPTYGQWYGVLLSAENKKQFFIPKGFAHGFLVLSEHAEFVYKCSDFYHPNDEGGLIWNDPDIGVEWPIPEGMELSFSDKDTKWGSFKEYRK